MSERARASQNLLSCKTPTGTTPSITHAQPQKVFEKSNKFPKFRDGDVTLVLSTGRVYQLHAGVLRRSSEFFSKILTEENGAILTPKAKHAGVTIRYRLDLVDVEIGSGHFVLRGVDSAGRTAVSSTFPDIENGKVPNEVYNHYDNLFRAFYNLHLEFDDQNLATVLRDSMGLVGLAENYGSADTVAESVDIALLRHGQILFKSIAQNPVAWSNFACRIKSPTIFKDCLIHLVGKWNMLTEYEKVDINPEVAEICERHYKHMSLVKQSIEMRILGHYCTSVQRSAMDNPGRAQYCNDIYTWMAISLFRHWFSQNILEKKNLNANDGGAKFYRQLARGGQAYLDRAQVDHFHLYCPMTPKGKTVFENHLNAYKADIQNFVQVLMVNRSQLEISPDEPLDHLLNLEVERSDYPWLSRNEQVDTDGASQ